MKVSVLGCGRWGSFIAWYLNNINMQLMLWGRKSSKKIDELVRTRKNRYLTFNQDMRITTDLEKAVSFAHVIVISISSQQLRNLVKQLSCYDLSGKSLVLCMKGIEEKTGKRLSEVASEYLDIPVAIWVGPGHVEDFVSGIQNCMVIDSYDESLKNNLVEEFSSDLIRFYYGTDLIGNEVGAAAKNVIGIAAGMLDGLGRNSLKGALMSRGTREIARLIKAMGGKEISAYGLAHLGDYQATLFSQYSHNRTFGEKFIKGQSYSELAEGASTVNALVRLGQKLDVDLPICEAVQSIIYKGADAKEVLTKMFLRSLKNEF